MKIIGMLITFTVNKYMPAEAGVYKNPNKKIGIQLANVSIKAPGILPALLVKLQDATIHRLNLFHPQHRVPNSCCICL